MKKTIIWVKGIDLLKEISPTVILPICLVILALIALAVWGT